MIERLAVLPSILLVITLSVRPVYADAIQITGGHLTTGPFSGELFVSGERGFTLGAAVSTTIPFFAPWLCNGTVQCVPGAPIDFGAAFVGSDLVGATVTLDGQTFTGVGLANARTSAAVFLSGSVIAPEFGGGTATVSGPFLFQGSFAYPNATNTDVIRESLFGQGTASLTLQQLFGGDTGIAPQWRFVGAEYEFAIVPEPATVFLAGTGLAAIAGFRRRNARQRSSR